MYYVSQVSSVVHSIACYSEDGCSNPNTTQAVLLVNICIFFAWIQGLTSFHHPKLLFVVVGYHLYNTWTYLHIPAYTCSYIQIITYTYIYLRIHAITLEYMHISIHTYKYYYIPAHTPHPKLGTAISWQPELRLTRAKEQM